MTDNKETSSSSQNANVHSPAFSPKEKTNKEMSWQWTSTELKNAIDEWTVLSNKPKGPSPDEQMLLDMQKLLKDLKKKMDEFSAD